MAFAPLKLMIYGLDSKFILEKVIDHEPRFFR